MTFTTAITSLSYYQFERKLWRQFGADIAAKRYDIVHRLTPLSPTTPSLFLAQRCHDAGVPFIWGPANGGVPWPREVTTVQHAEGEWLSYVRNAHKLLPGYRRTRALATALIAGSMSTWEQFSGHHDRCVYIPENAIDPERFPSQAEPWQSGPLRVAFIGRLVPCKGADMLIEAMAPIMRAGKVIVDIVGDGQEMPKLRALREREGLQEGVLLDGWVQHDQLQQRLSQAHVLGFPSVREFGGGVVLEAMALGLVPIVVAYAGPNELVSDKTGYRVPLGNRDRVIAGFRQVVTKILEAPEQLGQLRQAARERVMRKFTWTAKAAQVLEVYRWAIGLRDKPDFGMPYPDD